MLPEYQPYGLEKYLRTAKSEFVHSGQKPTFGMTTAGVRLRRKAQKTRLSQIFNRVRFTADIDMVIQVHPHHVEKIVKHFPDLARKENPLITEAEAMLRYMELNLKGQFPEEQWNFIQRNMEKRADEEWKQRFKAMKKRLGWSYQDIALFIGTGSSDAVKASVSRKLPAFAKLAVCVFEQVEKSGLREGKYLKQKRLSQKVD